MVISQRHRDRNERRFALHGHRRDASDPFTILIN